MLGVFFLFVLWIYWCVAIADLWWVVALVSMFCLG